VDIEKVKRDELKQATDVKKWMKEYGVLSASELTGQGSQKGKAAKRTR
jgi:hypothetical protein